MADLVKIISELIFYNALSPLDIFLPPVARISVTIGALKVLPWAVITLIASLAQTAGSLPLYYVVRRKMNHPWRTKFVEHSLAKAHGSYWRKNLPLWLVILNSVPYIDLVGTALAGSERFPLWRTIAVIFIGRSIHNMVMLAGGSRILNHPWFKALLGVVHNPFFRLGVVVVAMVGAFCLSREFNKAQIEYNKAQAVD